MTQLIEVAESVLRTPNAIEPEEQVTNLLMSMYGQNKTQVDAIITSAKTNINLQRQPTQQQTATLSVAPSSIANVGGRNDEAAFVDPLPEVPVSMKTARQWVRWKLEPGSNGKPTKVPYRTDGKSKASSTNPNDWGDYQAAVTGKTNSNE